MKRFALGLFLAAGMTTFVGCGEQAKPVQQSNVSTPPQDSGMSAGAPKPGEKATGGRSIPADKKP
jgi:hypothetical protein